MKTFTFRGGVHPSYCKDISLREPLREAPLPDTAVIPLSQHIGAPNSPLVKKGDVVEEGQILGKSDSFISAPVHSSVPGRVVDIKKAHHPALGPVLSVFIERDKNKEPKKYRIKDAGNLTSAEIVAKVKEAGIVGMGGAAFPTHVKLNVPAGKKVDVLIINGAECEPYLTCDHALMTRKTHEILKGIELIDKVLSPGAIYIAVEDNKKAAAFAFQKMMAETSYGISAPVSVAVVRTKYPQGGEKQLIKALSGREVPPGKLPIDIGILVQNVGTVYAVYEAVYYDKPLIERIVTISGDCMYRPGNYLVRVGSTIRDIVERYGIELYADPAKIISGGPMMGIAQPHLDVPLLKNTSGILFLSKKGASVFDEQQCIRCAKCVDVCPVRLVPTDIIRNVKKQRWEEVKELNIADCVECGACTYTCPARIPLIQYIKQGKAAIPK
ncbi:MAG: electron transport complex subunit RsxC [Candidatus Omnitrophota bacterium]